MKRRFILLFLVTNSVWTYQVYAQSFPWYLFGNLRWKMTKFSKLGFVELAGFATLTNALYRGAHLLPGKVLSHGELRLSLSWVLDEHCLALCHVILSSNSCYSGCLPLNEGLKLLFVGSAGGDLDEVFWVILWTL